jgi:hypothetical protein
VPPGFAVNGLADDLDQALFFSSPRQPDFDVDLILGNQTFVNISVGRQV